jgi:hypothetical protein
MSCAQDRLKYLEATIQKLAARTERLERLFVMHFELRHDDPGWYPGGHPSLEKQLGEGLDDIRDTLADLADLREPQANSAPKPPASPDRAGP